VISSIKLDSPHMKILILTNHVTPPLRQLHNEIGADVLVHKLEVSQSFFVVFFDAREMNTISNVTIRRFSK
jgi:hypothetical protein